MRFSAARITIIVSAVAMIGGLVSCGGDAPQDNGKQAAEAVKAAPSAAKAEATATIAPPKSSAAAHTTVGTQEEQDFLKALKSENISLGSNGDASWLGYQICADLGDTEDFYDTAYAVQDYTHLSDYDSGYVTGAAIGAICPQHRDLLPQ